MSEFREAFKAAKGYGHADSEEMHQGRTGINVMSREELEKGKFAGAGIRTKRQELSGEQLQKMEEISGQTREQDSMLDEISKGLDELKDLAEKMSDVSGGGWGGGEGAVFRLCALWPPVPPRALALSYRTSQPPPQELQLQDKMLNDLESKADKTQNKMDSTNDRMKDAMKKLNDKASNVCVYIICLFLLLGMVAVVYKVRGGRVRVEQAQGRWWRLHTCVAILSAPTRPTSRPFTADGGKEIGAGCA